MIADNLKIPAPARSRMRVRGKIRQKAGQGENDEKHP
jgi:hypothetical protein